MLKHRQLRKARRKHCIVRFLHSFADILRIMRVRAVGDILATELTKPFDGCQFRRELPDGLPLFTLQGGFDLKKLRGVYRLMMLVMSKTVAKKLSAKPDRTPEEDDMLDLLQNGGSRVKEDNLNALLQWYYSDKAGERFPE